MPTPSRPRTFDGHPIAFQRVVNTYFIGGKGYTYCTEYLVWNPDHPETKKLFSEADFFALTADATSAKEAPSIAA